MQILVLLPVYWNENDLLFTKRLQMLDKAVGYSSTKTNIKQ